MAVLEKRVTESERVYRILKGEILSGKLLPGERIVVAAVEKELGVSAMPIRSALKQLQRDGFVEAVPYVGAQVIKLDRKQFEEIADVRCILEPYAAMAASKILTDQDFEMLERILRKMEDCIENMDAMGYSDCNNEFHAYIYDRCGNDTLRDLIYQMWDLSKITRRVFPMSGPGIKRSYEEHKQIVEMMRRKNEAEVYRIFQQNNRNGFEDVKSTVERYQGG